jgi:GGDEF domain-containing protein
MTAPGECRRALIVAGPAEYLALRELLAAAAMPPWELLHADSFERARFVVQHGGCDLVLVDESLYRPDDPGGLSWLAADEAPVLLLADMAPEEAAVALRAGVCQWLPRRLALGHPPLLEAGLAQAARLADRLRSARRTAEAPSDYRRHVTRLVELLWASAPLDPRTGWLSQRHLLERLQEEAARTARHGTPLSVVLGEVYAGTGGAVFPAGESPLAAWTAERIAHAKRRCDVIGHYGPHGFLLLLPSTSEAGAVAFCGRLRDALCDAPPGTAPPVVAAFGITSSAADLTPKGLLRRAEERLEQARSKSGGEDAS